MPVVCFASFGWLLAGLLPDQTVGSTEGGWHEFPADTIADTLPAATTSEFIAQGCVGCWANVRATLLPSANFFVPRSSPTGQPGPFGGDGYRSEPSVRFLLCDGIS